jgi:hypothetical protein
MQPFVTRESLTQTRLVTAPQLSFAMMSNGLGAGISASHCTVMFVGQIITGGVVSTMVTVCWQVAVLPQASVMRHVLVAVQVAPQDALVEVFRMSMRFVPQESAAAIGGSKVHGTVHSTTLFVGQLTMGGVVSTTLTI